MVHRKCWPHPAAPMLQQDTKAVQCLCAQLHLAEAHLSGGTSALACYTAFSALRIQGHKWSACMHIPQLRLSGSTLALHAPHPIRCGRSLRGRSTRARACACHGQHLSGNASEVLAILELQLLGAQWGIVLGVLHHAGPPQRPVPLRAVADLQPEHTMQHTLRWLIRLAE